MGLDASVMCNCFWEGRTTPPPVPMTLIRLENGFLTLDLPYDGNEDVYLKFDVWSVSKVCEHLEGMDYACVWVANWHSYRLFQRALRHVGLEHFPVLSVELPNSNDGLTYPEAAAMAIAELAYFRAQDDYGTNSFLINTETGEIVIDGPTDGATFIWDGRTYTEVALEIRELVIREGQEMYREVFRSPRLEQRLLDPNRTESHQSGRVVYVDLETGRRVVCRTAIPGKEIPWPDGRDENDRGQVRWEYPRYLHVEQRRLTFSHFSRIVDALEKILAAAVATGNPVRWT